MVYSIWKCIYYICTFMYILYTCIYLVDLTKAVSTKGFTCVITEHNSVSFAGSLWLVSMRCCLLWRELRRFRTMWGSRRLSRCWMRTGMGGSNLSMPWRWGFKILFYILKNKNKIVQYNSIFPAKFTMATGIESKKISGIHAFVFDCFTLIEVLFL